MGRTWYPRVDDIINYNKEVLKIYKATKAEKHEIGGETRSRIRRALQSARAKRGDLEDKSIVLLRRINELHPFGSANRRTAHFAMNKMLYHNKWYLVAMKRERQAGIQKLIRQGKLSHKQIRESYKL